MPGIVVGVDGSGHSRKALERAANEAVAHHAPLTVLTVHQAVRDVYGSASHYSDDPALTDKAKEAAQAETDKTLGELDGPRPESVTVTAVHGFPAEVLVAASQDAYMVVLGDHGTTRFGHALMGSVASKVSHHAACPVLIIPPEQHG